MKQNIFWYSSFSKVKRDPEVSGKKKKDEELHMKTDSHTTVVLVDGGGSESIYLSPMEAWT